eukprot:TRINITY_DN3836_c0_g1_i1.p1 TRINITY_DN3836_c0_g1~~TRINITY_DN3836_c0_g1_i1.p1  ORF type:complete len:141 (+),score=9.87 TRINITY_DN3836_c0_g1_i1:423-845(+)
MNEKGPLKETMKQTVECKLLSSDVELACHSLSYAFIWNLIVLFILRSQMSPNPFFWSVEQLKRNIAKLLLKVFLNFIFRLKILKKSYSFIARSLGLGLDCLRVLGVLRVSKKYIFPFTIKGRKVCGDRKRKKERENFCYT